MESDFHLAAEAHRLMQDSAYVTEVREVVELMEDLRGLDLA